MCGKTDLLQDTQRLVLALIMVLGMLNAAFADEHAYSIEPIPSWVVPVPAFGPPQPADPELVHDYQNQLSDVQINGMERGNTRVFSAVEYLLSSPYGVENFSSIEIPFDSGYQTLSLHELIVKRDGVQINRLHTSNIDIIQSERNGTGQIYNGTKTLEANLEDLLIGDTIRYSYTLTGDNPVFAGNREFHVNTELWAQLDLQHVRLLSSSADPLGVRFRGTDVPLSVRDVLGVQEIVFKKHAVAECTAENGVPGWHEAQQTIVFSDMDSWQDVVEWARPVYQLPKAASSDVVKIAESIDQVHSSRDEKIRASLRWVQEKIDYIDVELGANSRLPSKPGATLKRGFGDSKDKAVLLLAILSELEIEAHAALVNTRGGIEADDFPFRMNAFNHVVVRVESSAGPQFMDPGKPDQAGDLGERYEPDYGHALVLMPDVLDLVAMDDSKFVVKHAINKELALPGEWSDLMRTSTNHDVEFPAPAARLTVTSRGKDLLAGQPLQSPDLNSYFVESYRIENFWNFNENVGEHRWLYADEIIGNLVVPESNIDTRQTYELLHPVSIIETWVVPISDNVRMHLEESSVDNQWISFTKTVSIDEEHRQATIAFAYKTLKNEVEAKDLERYVASVEQVNEQASFYLQNTPALAAASPRKLAPWNTARIMLWVVFLTMLCFTGWWVQSMRKYRKPICIDS